MVVVHRRKHAFVISSAVCYRTFLGNACVVLEYGCGEHSVRALIYSGQLVLLEAEHLRTLELSTAPSVIDLPANHLDRRSTTTAATHPGRVHACASDEDQRPGGDRSFASEQDQVADPLLVVSSLSTPHGRVDQTLAPQALRQRAQGGA